MIRLLTIAALALGPALPALAADTAEGETLAKDQSYTFRLPEAIRTLDPQKNADPQGAEVIRQLFEGLMNADAHGAPVPGVAASYDLSQDRLTYTFHLRPQAKWSNGDPVTAGDFVRAWRRLADPETASEQAWYLELMHVENATEVIKGAKKPQELGVAAPDDRTFQVRLSAPSPQLPHMLSHPATYPVNRKALEQGDGWTRPGTLVGNGAYQLESHDLGARILMVPNPHYWDAAHVVIRRLQGVTLVDDAQALARYRDGGIDRMRIPAGQYPALKQDRPAEVVVLPQGCTYGLVLNLGDKGPKALRDLRVRQALSLATPRETVVEQILQGGQAPAFGWTHPATQGFSAPVPEAAGLTPAQRLDRARALLAEAGYGPDRRLALSLTFNDTDPTHRKIAEATRDALKPLGVDLVLRDLSWKVQVERMQTGEFELARQTWCADYNEASTFLDIFRTGGANPGHFSDAEYDRLLDHARTAPDPAPDYAAAEAILQHALPVIPVYHYARAELLRGDIRGLPRANMMNEWWAKDLYRVAR